MQTSRARLAAALVLAAAALASPGMSIARPAHYQCGEALGFKIDFTPRKAQLHLNDKRHTLVRVKSARDAHYVNRKAGLTLHARKGDLTLFEGGREHHCKLQIAP